MRHLTFALLFLTACGGADFTSGAADPDAGDEAASSSSSTGGPGGEAGSASSGTAGGGAGGGATTGTAGGGSGPGGGGAGGSCVAKTCDDLGKDCGPATDGCGHALECGDCPLNETCGGDGMPGVCGACMPTTCEAEDVHCGVIPDGCGNTIDCGAYAPSPLNDFGQNSTGACPDAAYGFAYKCAAGGKKGASAPPPLAVPCIDDAASSGMYAEYFWCCSF